MEDIGDKNGTKNQDQLMRTEIAKKIIKYTLWGIFGYSAIYLGLISWTFNSEFPQVGQNIFNALLPLAGTWVGTVIAYYFSRENFEAASKSVKDMVDKLTPMQKLAQIVAKSKMIARSDMDVLIIQQGKTEKDINIVNNIIKFLDEKKRNRLPVLDEKDCIKYIIHRSIVDKYLARKATAGTVSAALSQLTLDDILNDTGDNYKDIFSNSFITLNEDSSLADAKLAIDKISNCLDVFITKDGKKISPVVGWLTNLIITEAAQI